MPRKKLFPIKVNQVIKHAEIPQDQYLDKVADVLAVMQRFQQSKLQNTVKVLQVQFIDSAFAPTNSSKTRVLDA